MTKFVTPHQSTPEPTAVKATFDPVRRRAILRGLGAGGMLILPGLVLAESASEVEVWKSPTCGCCKLWVEHLERNGFSVKTHDVGNSAIRAKAGIPTKFGACHTARIGQYMVEGHVPAADIKKLLADAPDAIGIAVPGMPIGSPGMDGPAYGNRVDPYDTLLIKSDGSAEVFVSHR